MVKYLLKNEPQSGRLIMRRSMGGAMEVTPAIPTRYRLRVKQRLAVVEYVKHNTALSRRVGTLA